MEAYCVKCRMKKDLVNPKPFITSNNRKAVKGHCNVCKTTLIRFLPK